MAAAPHIRHDVFISFRGKDTRRNFTSHLRAAFDRNGIDAFTDEGLRGGDEISPTLSAKIRESKASVLAFSPNFADSRWCLDELVEIMECHAAHGQTVLPVFLQGVEPTHVRYQTGVFREGFARLSQEARYADKVKSWHRALQQASNLSGWSSDQMSEEEIVENIVSRTQSVLDQIYSDDMCQPFIGIERVHKVESILSSPEVRNLGLWGLPGSGKTTLAGKIFQRISKNFDATCFVENVRDHAARHELNSLRNSLLSQLLGKHDQNQGPPVMFRSDFQRKLGRKRVLLILDDVSDVGQVQELIGDCRLLGPGSKVITTCRDQQVLKIVCDRVFEVKELDEHESLQLIKLHMFKQGEPTQDQLELLKQAVNYTQGLPLALVVLGRNLFDKDITFWKSELEKLSKIPDKQIEQILRTSFDGLEDTEKSIFLDIACVMEGWNKDRIIIIQDACGFYGTRGIARLADRALITISIRHEVRMHDLIKQIGQHIASHEGIKETGRPRRLWKMNEEVADVLTKTQVEGTRNIEVISMDLSTAASIKLRPKVFKKMSRLRILSFHNATASNCNPISLQKELNYLPGGLRYMQWDHYPLTSLPSRFNPCDLVELRMVGSNVTQLWIDELEPCLPSLKYVDLSQSKNLTTLPAFRNALKLEKLKVSFCCNLRYLPDSIQHLVELKSLHFDLAIRITGIPECSQLTKLHILSLHGCSKIRNLPQLRRNMTELFLIYPGLIESHSLLNKQCIIEHPWICMWIFPTIVHRLYLGGAPLSMIHLSSLTVLRCYEYKRDALPSWKGLVSLKELYLAYCDFESIQEDIKYLTHIWQITLYYCTSLSFIPELPTSLQHLDPCLPSLKYVDLSHSKNLTTLPAFRNALKLEKLEVSFCCNLKYLPDSIQHLVELKYLHFDGAISLTGIPECSQLTKLQVLSLHGCSKIRNLPQLRTNLTELVLTCPKLIELCGSVQAMYLLEGTGLILRSYFESPITLYLGGNPLSLMPSVIHLSSLTLLSCYGCKGDALPSLKGLVSLEELRLDKCDFKSIQEDIKYLTHLWRITLSDCMSLSFIPELPTSLQYLEVINCISLKRYEHISLSRVDHRLSSRLRLHLKFPNCINLEQDARNNIWKDFWLRVQFVLVPRVEMYGEQQTEEAEGRSVFAGVCIPGNGVPKLVKYSTIGSSLKVESNCGKRLHPLRFIFCAVVAVPRHLTLRVYMLAVTCQCISKSGETFYSRGRFSSQRKFEREHTIIWCTGFSPSYSYFTESTFQFSVDASVYNFVDKTEDLVEGVAIVKCGVTPIGRKFGTKLLPVMQDGSSPVVGERYIPVKRSSEREHGNGLEEQPPHSHKRKKIRKASTASEEP